MAKPEYQVMSCLCSPTPTQSLSKLHTKTLMKFMDIVRVTPGAFYKIIHNNSVLITYYQQVKAILNTRENVPNKQERKLARQQKANGNRH